MEKNNKPNEAVQNGEELNTENLQSAEISDEEMDDVNGGSALLNAAMAGLMMMSAVTPTVAAAAEQPALVETYSPEEADTESLLTADARMNGAGGIMGLGMPDTDEEWDIDDYITKELPSTSSDFEIDLSSGSNQSTRTVVERKSDGTIDVVKLQYVKKAGMNVEDFCTLAATNTAFYPGALYKANANLLKGNPTPVRANRRNVTISLADAAFKDGAQMSGTADPSKFSEVNGVIKTLAQGIKEVPGQLEIKFDSFKSEQELKMQFNFSESFWGKLSTTFEALAKNECQAAYVDVSQLYYTAKIDTIVGFEAFKEGTTLSSVKRVLSENDVPVYVDSVSYGKRVFAIVTSNDFSCDLKAAIQGSGMGVSTELSGEYSEKLNHCSIML